MNPKEGTTLGSRYTLTKRVAVGGMGQVWEALDTVLGRAVAVKLLHQALSQESDFADRFRAEARHAASLHHPNIAAVFDYGEDEGTAYLVMELVPGQPLSQIIAERAPLSAPETASILAQAATALQTAHQGGVVHRDVKPANILITPDGVAKLTDFGISRAIGATPMTQTGQVLGTAQYLAPEQALGQSATAASDIYSLGVVGYEMLTGVRPFDAGTAVATALAQVNQPPPALPESIPAEVRDVINAALAKDPADRPASAAAVGRALRMPGAALSSDVEAPPAAPTRTVVPPKPAFASTPTRAMPAPTRAMPAPTRAMPALTQVMPAQATPAEPGDSPDPRSRRRPAWQLGAIAVAVVLGALGVFALVGGDAGTNTPENTTRTTNSPAPTASANTVVASPSTSSLPSKPTPGKGNGKKKGK
ncbi:MAG: protein kinase [Actinomycetota bacterium]